MAGIWVSVVDHSDDKGQDFWPEVTKKRAKEALMAKKVFRTYQGGYVTDALVLMSEGQEDLEDIAATAFELGRQWERKYGPNNKGVRRKK